MKDELDQRLAKADPGKRAPKLDDALIAKAIAKPEKLSLGQRFELLNQNLRRGFIGVAGTATVGVLALAIVVGSTPKPIIQLAGTQGARTSESAANMMDGGADKMYMPFFNFEYLAGEGLSNENGTGQVYKLVRQSSPEEVLARVAEVFGVSGEINKYPEFDQTNQGYFFGSSKDPWGYDEVNPVISLWWSGTASWNYSDPMAYPKSICEETDADGNCSKWQDYFPTPELLPTKEEAIAKAIEVFGATGLPVNEADIRLDMSEWGVSASATMYVDGMPTNIEWYLGWSSTGKISYAGGHSVAAEAVGTFDTISAVAAVERLSDWRWSGSPASLYYTKHQPPMAIGEPVTLRDGSESSDDQPVSSDVSPQPLPETPAEPETVTLTITESETALLSVWDANGEVWLVPGYIMVNDQGWFSAIISLIEGVLELPKETDFGLEPMPIEEGTN